GRSAVKKPQWQVFGPAFTIIGLSLLFQATPVAQVLREPAGDWKAQPQRPGLFPSQWTKNGPTGRGAVKSGQDGQLILATSARDRES
ncbi:MAG: hypothetical protein LPJ92_15105, partial [Rhodobacterales bacterium]|nr:hypothetical protein [Rhodobacterales bacterium]MDX5391663.1 hypothetical protein [Rhodobacterales bacterium]MDX5491363.1 hypothetical protein [Rhodobacterales bacterium]